MAGKQPKYDVSLRGEEYIKNKWRWHNIGVAWENENGSISIEINFPGHIIIDKETKIRLFIKEARQEKEPF
jgi:hypothetical protein